MGSERWKDKWEVWKVQYIQIVFEERYGQIKIEERLVNNAGKTYIIGLLHVYFKSIHIRAYIIEMYWKSDRKVLSVVKN